MTRKEDSYQSIHMKPESVAFAEKLVGNIPGLEANNSNYGVVLSLKVDIRNVLNSVSQTDFDDGDAMALMRAAEIVCKEIFLNSSLMAV